jgi:GT2 family glycosyltransferase
MIAKNFPDYKLLQTPKNLGFAGACNHGLTQVSTAYVGFLNNDAFPEEGWAESLTEELDRDTDVAIVCSKIYQKECKVIDSAGGIIEYPLGEAPPRGYLEVDRGQCDQPMDVAYASGTALIGRTRLIREQGGFDASYRNYHEETDLSWRLRLAGYKIRYVSKPVVHHLGSSSIGSNSARKTFWQARNRCITNMKNLEASHVRDWLLNESVYASLVPVGGLLFPAYRDDALAYMQGLFSFAHTLPSTLGKRREVQARRKLSDIDVLKLHRTVTLPSLLKRNLRLAQTRDGHLFQPERQIEDSAISSQ